MKCEACERGDHHDCGMQTWCECDCDGPESIDFKPLPLPFEREKGPVEILCHEIGFRFDRSMETAPILAAFVRQLVRQVAHTRQMEAAISGLTGAAPSEESAEMLRLAENMLAASEPEELIARAARVHNFDPNPDDGPCDHLIDMLSSCASAIRFGLEKPCHSRHAASAAQHIWRRTYGIRLEDDITPHWSKHWARVQLGRAITGLALAGAGRDKDEDEAYEIGKRDGYESAIQDLDIATGGDGEFKGSTIPGATVDVPAMKQRIIARVPPC
jgi:hypothetical protein